MERLPRERQTVLFSATFSPEIKKLAQQLLHEPETIEVARRNTVSETITHRVVRCEAAHKRDALVELLQRHPGQALVFVDTKIACGRLASLLQRRGIQAEAIHGDKSQQQRFEVLEAFKNGSLRVLVATDVAARGLDIEELPFVINYALPTPRAAIRQTIGVAYGTDLEKAKRILLEVMKSHPEVLDDPAPGVWFTAFNNFSLDLFMSCWVASYTDRIRVTDELNMRILKAFAENGISIPYPTQDIYIRKEEDSSGKAVERTARDADRPVEAVPGDPQDHQG